MVYGESAEDFAGELARVHMMDLDWGYINKTGKLIATDELEFWINLWLVPSVWLSKVGNGILYKSGALGFLFCIGSC